MIGQTVSHYRILEKLGEGGMGVVYTAEDTHLGRKVALKLLPTSVGMTPDRMERFRREAKAIATLNHPNIVIIHSVEESEGLCFFTMELVDGATLGDHIPCDGLPLQDLFHLALPLVDAVRAAHERGVIHRDLKPRNIMVTSDGRLKVLDFGLAKFMAQDVTGVPPAPTAPLTEEGIAVGTIPYMSPEQLQGNPVDARSDIFSLGIILFEMATGRRPFRAGSPAEVASSILRDVPDSILDLRPELPSQLRRIIDRCLEKTPAARFQTAHDLRSALEDLRDESSMTTSARSTSPSTDATPSVGRQMIAVLPFENLGDPGDAYFADGISEEITSRLAAVSELGVISRTSAFQYDTGGKTVKEIGRDLGVDYILEGTVRWDRRGDGPSRVRITPQLIRVVDDTHLWSDRYDRVLEDIFAVQTDIAMEVVERLGATILESEKGGLQARPTENLIAYQAYLQGRNFLSRPEASAGHYRQAQQMLEQAVNLDPSFALAYVELSETHRSLYFYGYDRSEARLRAAKDAVDRALALQPDLAAAHMAMGYYYYQGHLDYVRALKSFAIAARSLPNDAALLSAIGYIWRRQGLMEQALVNLEQAAALSPQDSYLLCQAGTTCIDLRRFTEAIQWCERSISVEPDQQVAYLWEALACWGRGDLAAARSALERMPDRPSPARTWFWFIQEMMERNPQAALDRLAEYPEEIIEQQYVFAPKDLFAGIAYRKMSDPVRAGRFSARALSVLEEAVGERPDDPRVRSSLGRALAEVSRKEEAIREGELACELSPVSRDAIFGPHCIVALARILAVVGELDAALDRVEYLFSINNYFSLDLLKLDPDFDSLREHPRYARIIKPR